MELLECGYSVQSTSANDGAGCKENMSGYGKLSEAALWESMHEQWKANVHAQGAEFSILTCCCNLQAAKRSSTLSL